MPIQAEVIKARHLPKFRGAYISAYGEGWALYCERLGTEMGIYHTPYETFGMLSYQAWRAARLVVDTGIHSEGWTREQAQQYLRDNTALSDHEIETEVDRYISWPGQALSLLSRRDGDHASAPQGRSRARAEVQHPRLSRCGAGAWLRAAARAHRAHRRVDRRWRCWPLSRIWRSSRTGSTSRQGGTACGVPSSR